MMESLLPQLKKGLRSAAEWLRPDAPGATHTTFEQAVALTDRDRFSSLFSYRHFDAEDNICFLDDGNEPAAGFALAINPLLVAGVDAEPQFEAILNACPADTVVQVSKLVTPQVRSYVDTWAAARLANCENPLLRQIALRRRDFMLATATGPSMLPNSRLHPRLMQYYVTVRVPYKGDPSDRKSFYAWHKALIDLRATVQGALKGASMDSEVLDEAGFKFMLRELLNPHLTPDERVESAVPGMALNMDIVAASTRVTVGTEGSIGFARQTTEEPDVVVTPITVDAPPDTMFLPMMAQTLGDPIAWEERITCPYWAYTTIHVLDLDKSRDNLTARFGLLNKQTMSESPWFRSMMGHIYERKEHTGKLLDQTRKGHRLVRAYSGINIYTPPDEARAQCEFVKGLWRRAGFRVSEERFITLPAFVASLPLQYTPLMDPPNRGMQRATLMSSLHASSMLQIQGDWRGTPPNRTLAADGSVDRQGAGPLFVSRAGQIASFDLFQTTTNYNFVVVAASGSGKSFLANEIVCDFLSKGGIARLIDVGRSYYRFCQVMGGENLVFSADNPMSLNPFTGIRTQDDLNEMMPMLKDLLRLMAYPLVAEEETPQFQYQLLEQAIQEAWNVHNEFADLTHVSAYLAAYNDQRATDLVVQLAPFATGRYVKWFQGPRSVQFNNAFVVVELEELKQDVNLQAVVLQLVMHQVTTEMYLADRKIPKLLAIDEAWDLMGGLKTGKFIETAFRRMRKYNGCAGVITQSFEDFEKSAAAKAAIENAAWQFILYQKPESFKFAQDHNRIMGDEHTMSLLKTVKSGIGFSEIYVRTDQGSGLYRFVTDKHSYYTFTTKAKDVARLDSLVRKGATMEDAIDQLSNEDYRTMWGYTVAEAAANLH